MSAQGWSEHLDQLEEWLRRIEDPDAQPPLTEPVGAPAGANLLRAQALLAAMADREVELRRVRDGVHRADVYSRA